MGEQSVPGRRTGFGGVFISGYFGFGNLGDEAILEAIALELRRRQPSLAIAATFGEDRSTAVRLGVTPVDLFDLEACAHSILGADLVLFGLGGVFQDYWGATLVALFREGSMGIEAWVRPALLARMGGVPVALFCAGVGPLRTPPGRAMFRMACEAADLLLVRDETSALEILDIVPGATPIVAVDPAHDLEATEDDRRYAETALRDAGIEGVPISVAVRAWDLGVEREHLVRRLAAGLDSLPAGHPIVFLPFHRGAGTDDREVADAIRAALPRRATAVVIPRTGGQAIALFERSALAVAARNHGVVFAGCAKTPVVPIRYDPKVAASAADLGVDDLMVGIQTLERLPEAMSRALASRDAVVERMRACRAGLKARVQSAFDRLDGLVASRMESTGPSVTEADVVGHLRRERGELYQQVLAADRHVSRLASVEQDLIRLRSELQSLGAKLRGG